MQYIFYWHPSLVLLNNGRAKCIQQVFRQGHTLLIDEANSVQEHILQKLPLYELNNLLQTRPNLYRTDSRTLNQPRPHYPQMLGRAMVYGPEDEGSGWAFGGPFASERVLSCGKESNSSRGNVSQKFESM